MKHKRSISLLILLALVLSIAVPAALAVDDNTVHISTVEQLQEFSQNCSLDTYSLGKTVVLDNDLDLSGVEFFPIPTFSGTFDGGGHTISNMSLATDGSHQGLFRYIQASGQVKNLNVQGEISPENGRSQLGGIAGTNYGIIANCSFDGEISGLSYVGGIAGENHGIIRVCEATGKVDGKRYSGGIAGSSTGTVTACESSVQVNTSISQAVLELDSLSISDITNFDLTNVDDSDVVSDSGGIVGYSTGVINNCTNRGTVGYQHYGYNVGGIAGRQSGYINACTNFGEIYGRKDVGGIVGQMEPYMQIKESTSLSSELNTLQALVAKAMGNVSGMTSEISSALQQISDDASSAAGKVEVSVGGDVVIPPSETTPVETPAATSPVETAPVEASNESQLAEGLSSKQNGLLATGLAAMSEPAQLSLVSATDESGGTGGSGTSDNIEVGGNVNVTVPDSLGDELNSLAGTAGEIAGIVGDASGGLASDMVAVTSQLSRVIMLMANALAGVDMNMIEDISEDLPENNTDGKVNLCVNNGMVDADNNVGGIAGDMGIEYDFDLEGILSEKLGLGQILSTTYQTKCVCVDNINMGTVVGKKDNIGGIVGQTELGTVSDCQGYGSVSSTEGSYVGGIVGYSASPVRDSYAMCTLNGSQYVGGIVGYGTKISGCVSLIGIGDVAAWSGTIAGWADISAEDAIVDNVFVHDSLGAVDGISYEGKALAISYEELLQVEGLPQRFRQLKLSFVADGQLIDELEFTYGGSVDTSLLPSVPEKEGYNGKWPDYQYDKLYFSDTLEAVYTPKQATIAAKNVRDDSPASILLLEGDFEDGARVSLNEYNGEGPALEEGTVLEKWVLRLSSSGDEDEAYTARYLPPSDSGKVELYAFDGSSWSKLSTGQSGSYITFPCNDSTVVFCAVETQSAAISGLVIGIIAILLVAAVAGVVLVSRKKKAAKQTDGEEQASADSQTDTEATQADPEVSQTEEPQESSKTDNTDE